MSGEQSCEPPQMSVSPTNTAQDVPAALASFSPESGPQDVAQQCPYRAKSAMTSGQLAQIATARPKRSCDVHNLKVQAREAGATDKEDETVTFETIKASGGIPSRRPIDLPIATTVPEPIRSQLGEFDLVIEVIAPTSNTGVATLTLPGATADADHEKQMAKSKAKISASSTTTLVVGATWSAHCGDPNHSNTSLAIDDQPEEQKPAAFSLPIKSKSKAGIKGLWHFISSGLNPRVLGNRHVIKAASCGVTTGSPATCRLSTLVTAYPPGQTGLKLAFEGFAFKYGWTKADKYARQYREHEKDYLENTDAQAMDDRMEALKANEARLELKRPRGGKKIKANRVQLQTTRQEVIAMRRRLEAKEEMDGSPFSVNVILFDEEIEIGEDYNKAKKAFANIKKAEKTLKGIFEALSFLRTYSPGLVTPVARIDLTVFQTELFIGFKLSSDDRYKGARWRGLPRCFDIEVNCKVLEITGSFGAAIGKKVVGTGAIIEILFTPSVSISLGAEYASPNILTDEVAGWKETKLKVMGGFAGTASLSGEVTALSCKLAYISGSLNSSGRLSTENKLSDILDEHADWTWTLTLDPVGGMVEAYIKGKKDPWQYPYEIWQGGVWDL